MKEYSMYSLALTIALAGFCHADSPKREPLWPNGAPGAKGSDESKHVPAVTIYRPARTAPASRAAVVVCPGGGYGNLALGHEGREIADWLNSLGITAAILEYRMARGGYRHPIPLLDAQRAIRTIRSRSDELDLDQERIGIMGFSAGGHLAATVGTHFDGGNQNSADPVERCSSRPDFLILCYPVIAFGEPFTHKGSQRNLIGENPPRSLVESLSNEKQVTKATPPAFLFHTDADTGVPAENSTAFYLALRKAGVPAELHIFRNGRHGVGLAKGIPGTREWPKLCEGWLRDKGLIGK